MKEYKYLSQCKDFAKLLRYCTKEQLAYIENIIAEYKEQVGSIELNEYEGYNDIISWYEGLIPTDDLLIFINDIWG